MELASALQCHEQPCQDLPVLPWRRGEGWTAHDGLENSDEGPVSGERPSGT